MTPTPQRPSPEQILRLDRQEVRLPDWTVEGFILDVGGGGEGTIGRWKGRQVVAIDPQRHELVDAPPGPLKLVLSACDLGIFLDESFAGATAFFSFFFIPQADHCQVLTNVFRKLAPGGELHIWDVNFPPRPAVDQEYLVIPLRILLPGEVVETGFGVRWPAAEQNAGVLCRKAEQVGFAVLAREEDGPVYHLALRKPPAG